MSVKLYVGNLSFQTTQQDLEELFGQVGQVESVSIVTDRDTGQPRGFAFVEMAGNAEAQAAIESLDGREVDGRALKVNEARPKEDRGGGARRGGFGGGGRSGGRGPGGGGGGRGGFSGGRGNRY
jgi:RNA recognition motif-containing protein